MTVNIRNLITREKYEIFAGSSWPHYDDFLTGSTATEKSTQEEIDQFLSIMIKEIEDLGVDLDDIQIKTTENNSWQTIDRPVTWAIVDHDLMYNRKIKNLPNEKTGVINYCSKPWNTVDIDFDGRIFLCGCGGWLPFPVGNVMEFNNITEIFNTPQSKDIQQSILDRNYKYCDIDTCGLPKQQPAQVPKFNNIMYLSIGIDKSCNLSCPSCRERSIFFKPGKEVDERINWADRIIEWIKTNPEYQWHVRIGSDGDPFVGYIYTHLITRLQNLTNVFFEFKTNGLFIKRALSNMVPEFLKQIELINVSIDAGTAPTYENIRRGGSWKNLLDNLEYLKNISKQYNINTSANLIVQEDNLDDIYQFVELCNNYSLTPIFLLLEDWGTWHNFKSKCVHLDSHPRYNDFLKIFSDPKLKHISGVKKILNFNK